MGAHMHAAKSAIIRDILFRKEKNGLRMQVAGRIVIILAYLPLAIILSHTTFESVFSSLILLVTLLVTILFLVGIHRYRHIRLIGVAGAVYDVMLIVAFALNWYLSVGGTSVPPSFLTKNLVPLLSIFFIIMNSQAMKPLYPLIVTVGATALQVLFFAMALNAPGAEIAYNYFEAFTSVKISLDVAVAQPLFVAAIGGMITWLTHNAQNTIRSAAAHERTSAQLGRFFSPNVAEKISRSDDDFVRIGGTIQNVAVLFSDIRDFTSLSEDIPPDEVLSFLSEYHELMVGILFRNGGTLDKFIGDAIMATFGTPSGAPDDALRAVRAGIEMERALVSYNASRKERGLFTIRHGIGIHYGPALVGNIGTPERLEYTVLGDSVNVASRIEQSCKATGESLLFSESVRAFLAGVIETRYVGSVAVKGKTGEVALYTVADSEKGG
jgi:adenylate cyclase